MSLVRIPIYKPFIGELERKYLLEAFDSGWISTRGDFIDRAEDGFAKLIGSKYAITVSNGSVACQLAIEALNLPPNSDILCPAMTFIATANAIKHAHHNVILCDVNETDWNISIDDCKQKMTNKTAGIMPVHLYGQPANMDELIDFANDNELYIIEDACEAIGAKYKDYYCGTSGHSGAFSYWGNKSLTAGNAGMIVTDSEETADKVKSLKGQGVDKSGHPYSHDIIAYNGRLSNLLAAILVAQIERYDEIMTEKTRVYNYYKNSFSEFMQKENRGAYQSSFTHGGWMTSLKLPTEEVALLVKKNLLDSGIDTRPNFVCLYRLPPYKADPSLFPNCEKIANKIICLPSYPALKEVELEEICQIIDKTIKTTL